MGKATKAIAREKERRVIAMILAGATFQDVVDAGIYKSTGGAYDAYTRAIARDVVKDVEQIRNTELRRIDSLLKTWFPMALGRRADPATGAPPVPPDDEAAKIVMKLMAERRKYVGGLEAPQVVEAKIENVSSDEFAAWLAGAEAQFRLEQDKETSEAEA